MRRILGIDPGIKGGLSVIDEQFNFIEAIPMPVRIEDGKKRVDPHGIYEFISRVNPDLTVIEKVGAMRKPTKKNKDGEAQGTVSMFTFGDSFGLVRSIAEIFSEKTIYVRPQKWRGLQSLTGLSKEQIAEIAFEVFRAEQIYGKPRAGKRAVRDGISDSLMIAKAGVRFLE